MTRIFSQLYSHDCPTMRIMKQWILPQLAITAGTAAALSAPSRVRYRRGEKRDEFAIATTMAKSLMNPLSIDGTRFVMAEEDGRSRRRIGWAQLRPLGPAYPDPGRYDSPPGSIDIEREVDDAIWDEFESDDSSEFPNGFASLPWTREYRAASRAAESRRNDRDVRLSAERQGAGQLWELASVYVDPTCRGRGVGAELVRSVLSRHVDEMGGTASDVYALTLAKTVGWYRQFGFEVVEVPPNPMRLEFSAGTAITKMIGEELVCICGGNP